MAAKIDFYTHARSRGRIVHWLLEELGEPYQTHWLEYGGSMKDAAFLRINPMGKVPALVYDGAIVTECPAILTFLAAMYPGKGLIPAEPAAWANCYRWMFFAAGPVEQATTAKAMQWTVAEEQKPMLGFGDLDATLDVIEMALGSGPWLCGERFSAADVYIGSQVNWGMQFGTVEPRPVFEQYAGRCTRRAAWKRAESICNKRLAETAQA